MLFAFMGILIGIVYGLKEDKIISSFMNGAADLLSVALIVAIARGIQVIMNNGMITDTILNWGKEGLSGLSSQVLDLHFLFANVILDPIIIWSCQRDNGYHGSSWRIRTCTS